jgi:predicted secreted hydrolase
MKHCLISLAIFGSACFLRAVAAADDPPTTPEGFAIPQPGRQFAFPRDHGSHPEFAIEWWYVTGHLTPADQSHFGFQATFFRRALRPPRATESSSPTFGNDQIYLAHMAVVDESSQVFHYQERLNRSGWDAGAATGTLDVRNGNWSLRLSPNKSGRQGREVFELTSTVGADTTLLLDLTPTKPLVVFGSNGVSRKAADPKASSHYLTFSRMSAKGTLSLGGEERAVSGEAWMDHEFSSSQLGEGQIGWDWLSLQLFDGRELMAYRMRRSDGSTDPFSTVAWIDEQGSVSQVGPADFTWEVLQRWRSQKTGAEYPAFVKLIARNPVTSERQTFLVQPAVADQELAGSVGGVAYWEGACRVLDENKKEIGRAYMELTGYSESLKGKF